MLTALKVGLIVGILAALIAGPPLILGTSVYPVAVVSGNSMFPVLHNGDLVIFRHINAQYIPNGTIIVFVEGEAPVNSLNYLVRPTVIHEVIGRVVNQYGRIYYETKGVNNPYPDPGLVPEQNVLGTPVAVVPYAGFIITFFVSPEGLVALIGILTIYYIGSDEKIRKKEEFNRMQFIAPFVFLNRIGKLPNEALIQIYYIAEHCDSLVKSGVSNKLAAWLTLNIDKKWMYHFVKCDKGDDEAIEFFGNGVSPLKICVKEVQEMLKEQSVSSDKNQNQQ